MTPPKDPYIKVRVVKGLGDVLLEEQAASLTRNSIHMVKRAEVETLISQVFIHPLSHLILFPQRAMFR
jgi:GINS complex subunit 1